MVVSSKNRSHSLPEIRKSAGSDRWRSFLSFSEVECDNTISLAPCLLNLSLRHAHTITQAGSRIQDHAVTGLQPFDDLSLHTVVVSNFDLT